MNLITALHAIVSQLPVHDNSHGGAQASDSLLSITKPRGGCLYRRVFLRATSGPEVAAAVDPEGRLVLHDSENVTGWVRAEMDSYLMAEEFQ